MAAEVKTYAKELKEQILKELNDTANMASVARNHGIAYQTVSDRVVLKRQINLEPGYLAPSKLVLASTKDASHRASIRNFKRNLRLIEHVDIGALPSFI